VSDCVELLRWALPRLGMRWAGFRKVRRQVCRRIHRRAEELGLADLPAYREHLEGDPAEWAVLDGLCRVTISRFLRDRGVWETLGHQVLPALASAGRTGLRCWSAGCASGEEPYSLVLVWHQLGVAPDLEVVATDTDPVVLERARRATYPDGSLRELPETWRREAFEVVAEQGDRHRLHHELRGKVCFALADVRDPPPHGAFDLVLCRNLAFTYYGEQVQRAVLDHLHQALRPGGALVIGKHESLPLAGVLEVWSERDRIYRRPGARDGRSVVRSAR